MNNIIPKWENEFVWLLSFHDLNTQPVAMRFYLHIVKSMAKYVRIKNCAEKLLSKCIIKYVGYSVHNNFEFKIHYYLVLLLFILFQIIETILPGNRFLISLVLIVLYEDRNISFREDSRPFASKWYLKNY